MKVITAIEQYEKQDNDVFCFLAGGITNCPDWQSEVIENLQKYDQKYQNELDSLVIFNPRRPNFPIDDPNASLQQITWEFQELQRVDIFKYVLHRWRFRPANMSV